MRGRRVRLNFAAIGTGLLAALICIYSAAALFGLEWSNVAVFTAIAVACLLVSFLRSAMGTVAACLSGVIALLALFTLLSASPRMIESFGAGWILVSAALIACLWFRVRGNMRLARIPSGRELAAQPESTYSRVLASGTPGYILRHAMRHHGGGAYLGAWAENGEPLATSARSAFCIIGGPGSGKTRTIVTPAVMAHPGPVVSASTKPEVIVSTHAVRASAGRVFVFDPSGQSTIPAGASELRWSPVTRSASYDSAQLVAAAMVQSATFGADHAGGGHWLERSASLLASFFHAAALGNLRMSDVHAWIVSHDIDAARAFLPPGSLAQRILDGFERTPERERGSIFSTAAGVIRAYGTQAALASADPPQAGEAASSLDASEFARSEADTIYIVAPSSRQQMLAPLVVGLLTDIREAAYEYSAELVQEGLGERRDPPILWALDECANIAPVPDLPAICSEAGGQGLQVLTVFQDLSQVRKRWPADAGGFLSLMGTVALLPGVRDRETLETASMLIGDWDRPVETYTEGTADTRSRDAGTWFFWDSYGETTQRGKSVTTRRERIIPPERIAQLEDMEALVFITGGRWDVLQLAPWDLHPVFEHLAATESAQLAADFAQPLTLAMTPAKEMS